jgi:hypothetical protein
MPVADTDLRKFQSVNVPESDTGTTGGAINAAGQHDELILAANDTLEALSDGADVRTITVVGRDAAGEILTAGPTALNGATPVALTGTFERVLKVTLSAADGARTVTLRRAAGGATVCTLTPNITSQRALFYDSASAASPVTRYQKEYWKNEHGTLSLLSANLRLTADPQVRIRIGLEASADQTSTNRVTAPGGVTFVDDAVDVSVGTLAAGATIGLWIEQALLADDAAFKSTYTTRLQGSSA